MKIYFEGLITLRCFTPCPYQGHLTVDILLCYALPKSGKVELRMSAKRYATF